MTDTRQSILIAICDALATAVNQCQSLTQAATNLCPQADFDKLDSLSINVTPYNFALSSPDRSSTKQMNAQFTVWVASPGGAESIANGVLLQEDIANGLQRQTLSLTGQKIKAVVTKTEVVTVYDLQRLLEAHTFLSALRVHVIAWYKL